MLQPSLFRHLMAWAIGAQLVVWVVFVLIGFRTGVHEADELTDGHLSSVASLILAQHMGQFSAAPSAATLGGRTELKAHDYQQSLSIVTWDSQGRLLARTGEAPTPEFTPSEGFVTLVLGSPPMQWRAFSRWAQPAHDRKIMVLLSVEERDALADDIAIQVATPGIWLLPVIAMVLTLAIRQGLRPLMNLSQQIRMLDIHRDTRLHAPPHAEFKAVADSTTMLIDRYNAALDSERALASEVAHELRTPLATMSLHAFSLRQALSPNEREEALTQIEHSAARARTVLTHLLALARASRTELAEAAKTTDLSDLARRVTAEYGQAAYASGHEISVATSMPCMVKAHPVLLEIALRNLIDNALAHTPRGSSVRVSVSLFPPSLAVCDSGRVRRQQGFVTDQQASSGLGLGHQVVRRIATVHGGRFDVEDQAEDGMTCYRIVLGLGAAAA
jgi:two-component system sensor histidine kinase QseC